MHSNYPLSAPNVPTTYRGGFSPSFWWANSPPHFSLPYSPYFPESQFPSVKLLTTPPLPVFCFPISTILPYPSTASFHPMPLFLKPGRKFGDTVNFPQRVQAEPTSLLCLIETIKSLLLNV